MDHDLPEVDIELDIPFYDLDPVKIVWFGNMYKYFERARAKLMGQINYKMKEMKASGYVWPVIESKCRHKHAIKYEERIRVNAKIVEYQSRLKIDYKTYRIGDGERIAMGHTVQVAVEAKSGDMLLESPPVLYDKLGIPHPESDETSEE